MLVGEEHLKAICLLASVCLPISLSVCECVHLRLTVAECRVVVSICHACFLLDCIVRRKTDNDAS